jgi:hypothetical protein
VTHRPQVELAAEIAIALALTVGCVLLTVAVPTTF